MKHSQSRQRRCSLCRRNEPAVWRVFAKDRGAVCNECIAELADELNDAHVDRSSRQMPTEGREDLVLRRRGAIDAIDRQLFLRGTFPPALTDVAMRREGTVGELIDEYAVMCARLRRGDYEIPSLGDPRYLVTDALLAAFRAVGPAEWIVGQVVPLRFERKALIVGSARAPLADALVAYLSERTKQRVRIVGAPACAVQERIHHLDRLASARKAA